MRSAQKSSTIDHGNFRPQGVLILVFTLAVTAPVFSQPANDDCSAAIVLSDGIPEAFDTTTATADIEPTCVPGGPTVWYAYTASCNGTATISLCGSGYDTRVAVFDGGAGCPIDTSTELDCNDDACLTQSELTLPVSTGLQLYVQVGGFLGDFGAGTITITCVGVAGPEFKRGDVNGDGCVALADANYLYSALFIPGSPPPECFDAADANDDGSVNVSDAIIIVNSVIPGGTLLPDFCVTDSTSDLIGCGSYISCGPCSPTVCEAVGSSGTIALPPPCGYVTPAQVHMMIAGLPPGTVVQVGIIHGGFSGVVVTPGGTLGGQIEQFDSTLTLNMQGTGALAGFSRSITISAPVEIHTAPAQPGEPVQTFDTEMMALSAGLVGDPDFDLLQITAGTDMGLTSPGATTLTQNNPPGSPFITYEVDSYFYVHYHIDFVGAPTGLLAGMSGTTNAIAVIGTPGMLPVPLTQVMSGNLNADGNVDLGDAITLLSGLFPVSPGPLGGGVLLSECPAAFDCNADDLVNIADPIYLLSWLFSSGPPLPAWGGPAPSCGAAGLVLGCLFPGSSCP
ncbi:MAG: dockerin type I domain-containing protein [Planctomycetota bacterium]